MVEEILGNGYYERRIRCLSAAITRVELDQRRRMWRLVEYAYVLFRLPGNQRVTVGPAQTRLSRLVRPVACCACERACWLPSLAHCLGRHHQALAVLAEVRTLFSAFALDRDVINAYNKGVGAADLRLPTVYSEVVLSLATKYEASWPVATRSTTTAVYERSRHASP